MWRRLAVVLPAVVVVLASAPPANAQTLRGRVLDHATRRGLPQVSILLLSDADHVEASVLSDSAGVFFVPLRGAGSYGLRVERPGYRPFLTTSVDIEEGEEVALELRMATASVVAAPVTVIARRRVATVDGFEERVRFMRLAGVGHFLTRSEIEALRASAASEVLATLDGISVTPSPDGAQVSYTAGSASCVPAMYVDGLPLRGVAVDRIVTPDIMRAIELYRGAGEGLVEFPDASGCGVVLVWTLPPAERSLPWRRAIVYAGMIALGVALFGR